jgi:hypothetical protein
MASDLSSLDLLVMQIAMAPRPCSAEPSVAPRRSSAVRSTRPATPWSGCPKTLHTSVRRVLRQAWELDDAGKAEKLLRNLAQRLERDRSEVAGSILEGIDEILIVTRLGLPKELRRSLVPIAQG